MSKHDPQKAMVSAEIAIMEAINHAKKIANKYDLSFEVGFAYGMGGTYYSPGSVKADKEYWENNGTPEYSVINNYGYYVSEETGGWVSSSMEC